MKWTSHLLSAAILLSFAQFSLAGPPGNNRFGNGNFGNRINAAPKFNGLPKINNQALKPNLGGLKNNNAPFTPGKLVTQKLPANLGNHNFAGKVLGNNIGKNNPKFPGKILDSKLPGKLVDHKLPGKILDTKLPGKIIHPGKILDPKFPGKVIDPKFPGKILDPKFPGKPIDPGIGNGKLPVGHHHHWNWWYYSRLPNFGVPLRAYAPAGYTYGTWNDSQPSVIVAGTQSAPVTWYFGVSGMVVPDLGIGIDSVKSGSPAEAAGLKPGMVLTTANGTSLTSANVLNQAIAQSNGMLELQVLTSEDAQPQAVAIQLVQMQMASF